MDQTSNKIIRSPVLVLIGPTAIGKTALSLELATMFGCEIISVDSMQVYRYMDIGTAKPGMQERRGIQHYLIDIVDPDEQFDAAQFVEYALHAIDEITCKGKIPLLTGGTGMYFKALIHGLFDQDGTTDPEIREELFAQLERDGHDKLHARLQEVDPRTADRLHPHDTQRLLRALEIYQVSGKPWSKHIDEQSSAAVNFTNILQIGLYCERDILYRRIEKRSSQMIDEGLIQEVEGLRKMGYKSTLTSMQSIGYRHINNYLDGTWDMDETMRLLVRDTRRYAKRQLTWFRNDPAIEWIDRGIPELVLQRTEKWLNE